jgi:hypothetical protein
VSLLSAMWAGVLFTQAAWVMAVVIIDAHDPRASRLNYVRLSICAVSLGLALWIVS